MSSEADTSGPVREDRLLSGTPPDDAQTHPSSQLEGDTGDAVDSSTSPKNPILNNDDYSDNDSKRTRSLISNAQSSFSHSTSPTPDHNSEPNDHDNEDEVGTSSNSNNNNATSNSNSNGDAFRPLAPNLAESLRKWRHGNAPFILTPPPPKS